jgi:recombination protein RecT
MGELTVQQYKNQIATAVANDIVARINGGLVIPQGYNLQNSLVSAMYQIGEAVTTEKKPVLQGCTEESIKNALTDMVTKGLDPNKGHCYWIAYGNKLNCTESYFGKAFRAKRADPSITDIFAEVVYEKDIFEYEIKHGTKIVTEHCQSADSVDDTKVKGAYCTILYNDGRETSDYMTMAQIRQSWNQSKTNQDVHKKFPTQMAKRTVMARLTGMTLKTGTTDLLIENDIFAEDFDQEAELHEATEILDITDTSPQEEVKTVENIPQIEIELPDCLK